MASTQEHLSIKEIINDLVVLKNGDVAVVLNTSAVNFGLLSENEQMAIIDSFAGFLNSLSFAIQIVIRSEWLDISIYLKYLQNAREKQKNALLADMVDRYRLFIEKTVKENKVLDKQFYIIILVSSLELGFFKDIEGHMKKALTTLVPRRDHVLRQLWRMGLKAEQLKTRQLIKLFYSIYNRAYQEVSLQAEQTQDQVLSAKPQEVVQQPIEPPPSQPSIPQPDKQILPSKLGPEAMRQPVSNNLVAPFVVEELTDEYITV